MPVIVKHKMVFNTAQARKETLEGVEYLVVPVVIFTNGVHVANAGAVNYSPEENERHAPLWNQVPITVYHPEVNGELVSARSPEMAEKRQIGFVFNAGYDNKTQAEAWLNIAKTNKVDDRIIPAIESNKTLEISGGVLLDKVVATGEVDGVKYDSNASNIRPDHLAILPDKIGACSTKKGCGCGTNVLQPLVANEASYSTVAEGLREFLDQKYPYSYIKDIFPSFFIFAKDYKAEQLWKLDYTVDKEGDVAVATTDPVEVQYVTEYRDMNGTFVGNSSKETVPEENDVAADTRKKLIADILACNVGYEEADFEGMKEPALQKVLKKSQESVVANKDKEEEKKPPVKPTPPPKSNTLKDWLVANSAPQPLHQMLDAFEQQHAELVANIMAMPTNKLSETALVAMNPFELAKLKEMLTPVETQVVPTVVGNSWFGGQGVGNSAANGGNNGKKQRPLAPVDAFAAVKK